MKQNTRVISFMVKGLVSYSAEVCNIYVPVFHNLESYKEKIKREEKMKLKHEPQGSVLRYTV